MDHGVFYLLAVTLTVAAFTDASSMKAKNLALYGKATQSFLVQNPWTGHGHAYNAIDGNTDSNYDHGSCTATTFQPNPWWRVDLLDEYTITSITITNRGDCCSERINGAEIRIGNSLINEGNDNPRVAVVSSIPAGKDKTFNFGGGVSGRYVNIIIPGKHRILTLCEVQVFGSRRSESLTQIPSQLKNLALAGKATQSSFVDQPYKIFHGHPYKAIDGKNTSEYSKGSCTHTETQDNPWWRLDLQDEYTVTSVTVTNRGDCCSERLNGAEIRIGNSLSNDGNSNPRVGVISSISAGKSQTFTLNQGVSGRYVNVIIPGKKRILTLCEVEVFGYHPSQVKNLAPRGKATQSSLAFDGHPSKAIDKNKDTNYHQGSCTHTVIQQNPWWRVDLLDEFTITSIVITNRGDCCAGRLEGAEIHVGNSLINNGNDNPRVEVIKSIPAGKSQTFHLKKEVSGRYVNLIIPGSNQILTLCEVEVFGYHPSQVRNIAFGGTATQSSFVEQLYATHGDPSKAIDGKTTSEYSQGSCTHTETQDNPWWRLDLQDEYNIYSIYITNRGDCCSERINGAEIRVGNSLSNNGNDNPRVGVISSIPAGKSKSFHFKEGVSGRYLNVIIPGKKRILTLCEVQVFGFPRSEGNAALKGFAAQSSNYGTGCAIKAIDGNRDGNYFSGSCTHTKYDLSPWWKLDLQKTHKVSSITITNRQDAVPERLNGAEIRIGDNPAHNGIQNPKCGVISSIGKNPSVTFQCNGMKGRYVTIVIPGRKEYLTLCEVEVFGAPVQ
ncbi:uncharacterized protein LOC103037467 [Astyanax mexicanus]|uniref:uncharacterized protein LOC103037467 n=1 Tax=Astyanax mexicanus TaxID=7994 RepID=UPI0020CAB68E|nr:uncharacterized protein LOC103037467 [Astyanax mexicanus]